MRLLDADVIENLLHSSSISKGIERTMEHIINEMAVDSMYIIHYEEGFVEPYMPYSWENGTHKKKHDFSNCMRIFDDWGHFEEGDLYVAYDRNRLSDVARKFYEKIGIQTAIEFQMHYHGNAIGYIFLGWEKQHNLEDEEVEAIHVLAKLMNDRLIKELYDDFMGDGDWRVFRIANSMTKTLIYMVDQNYRIRFSNHYAQ